MSIFSNASPLKRAILRIGYKGWFVIPLQYVVPKDPHIHLEELDVLKARLALPLTQQKRPYATCSKYCLRPRFRSIKTTKRLSKVAFNRTLRCARSKRKNRGNYCKPKFYLASLKLEKEWTCRLGSWEKPNGKGGGFNNQNCKTAIRKPRVRLHARPFVRRRGLRPDHSPWTRCNPLPGIPRQYMSRDWFRRLRFAVLAFFVDKKLDPLFFRKHVLKSLLYMRMFVDKEATPELIEALIDSAPTVIPAVGSHHSTAVALKAVDDHLKLEIRTRFPARTGGTPRPKTKIHNLITFGFTDAFFDRARFNGVVRSDYVREGIPVEARDDIVPPSIVYKFASTIGLMMDNSAAYFSIRKC